MITLYSQIFPPLVDKKKEEKERVMPVRKRTALVDQRISRSRLSSETSPQDLLEAQHADGFIDFYTLLAATPSVGAEELREQINTLYKDAQTDRDHRTPTRRREAQLLLELLPQARTILLDPKRRRRYDAYRGAVEMQSPRMPFEEFLPSLLNERESVPAAADILSVSRRSIKTVNAPTAEAAAVGDEIRVRRRGGGKAQPPIVRTGDLHRKGEQSPRRRARRPVIADAEAIAVLDDHGFGHRHRVVAPVLVAHEIGNRPQRFVAVPPDVTEIAIYELRR
ncbi:MAG: hypothetical protein EOO77_35585 [Oxalobacteraceae bacterium]|nr:MAG: hypothetical protein EOO77_35585 [Oxalobacteraceae bacterium]